MFRVEDYHKIQGSKYVCKKDKNYSYFSVVEEEKLNHEQQRYL